MKKRFGDTLVEVALAVGIFSMVAIAVVSVVSGSISDAQGALELTVTREEIDSQAEALRFIHSAYVSNVQDNSTDESSSFANSRRKYQLLWNTIKERASGNVLLQPLTDSCADYNNAVRPGQIDGKGALTEQKAFAIDTKNLGTSVTDEGQIKSIIITPSNNNDESLFKEASTYPRLVYDNVYAENLIEDESANELSAVEGLYIVAVSDESANSSKGHYYDFYIRACWYGVGATTPSTISTVVRLYDPEAI